jgi:hypothetical protein
MKNEPDKVVCFVEGEKTPFISLIQQDRCVSFVWAIKAHKLPGVYGLATTGTILAYYDGKEVSFPKITFETKE